MDVPAAKSDGSLCQRLINRRTVKIAAIIVGIIIRGIGQQRAEILITATIDSVRLRTETAPQSDIVQRVGHQLGVFCRQTLVLGQLVRPTCLFSRHFSRSLCLKRFLAFCFGAEGHFLCDFRLPDGFTTPFFSQFLLTIGYLLHLLADTPIDQRLFLLFAQFAQLRLQGFDALLVTTLHQVPCCKRTYQQNTHTPYDDLLLIHFFTSSLEQAWSCHRFVRHHPQNN